MPQPQGPRSHIVFEKINIEKPRHKYAAPRRKPARDNVQYGAALDESVVVIQRDFVQVAQEQPPNFDPAFIFRLQVEPGQYIDEDEWRRSNLTVLSVEKDGVVVLFSPDQLAEFQRRIAEYGQAVGEGRKLPSYNWLASITTTMSLWGPEDRRGRKLRQVDIAPLEHYSLDVELWHYGTRDECRDRMAQLREFVIQSGGRFLDNYIGSSLSLARVNVSGTILNQLLQVGLVKIVDRPPSPDLIVGQLQLLKTRLDDFRTPAAAPPDDAPHICIVDSGINRGHPMLGPAIGYTQSIPADAGDGLDQNGHGTMVAGIALYGDVKQCIDSLNFEPQLHLYSARVTNADNLFDDERLIVNQMQETIETFHQTYGCRVFNVSLGDPRLVYEGGKPSPWAYILDTLARDLDVVIVVSAGNLPVLALGGDEAHRTLTEYPAYLLNPEARIIEPATAANVLTVGALAHTNLSHLMTRYPNDPAIRCIADIDQPSPFTRSGPGVGNAIKPEVCDYGGNVTWDGRGNRTLSHDPETGIISLNFKHLDRLFATHVGTSFSTPRVTHLAGLILKHYPNASANLIRALIANAARIPAGMDNIFQNEDDLLRVSGYGQPDPERALYSTDSYVTLIAEDEIPLDGLHLYEIPIPEEFQHAGGQRRITVSLAFDPPVRHTRQDYLGLKLKFRLLRGLTTERIIEWYAERPANANPDAIPGRHNCIMSPSPQRREGGTLQKAVFKATLNQVFTSYEGDRFHLLITSQSGWATPTDFPQQCYALAVTLEHLTDIELYNVLQQRVILRERVRVRP